MEKLKSSSLILIGYGGHAWVVADAWIASGRSLAGYFDQMEKKENPYQLAYLGSEESNTADPYLSSHPYHVAIGHNDLRYKVVQSVYKRIGNMPVTIQHPTAVIATTAKVSYGCFVAPRVVINSGARVGEGVLLNTACLVEHECCIGDYTHIAPGAILTGRVNIGKKVLIGAGAVILPGITIGSGATIGAGSVVHRNIPAGKTATGHPARVIKSSPIV